MTSEPTPNNDDDPRGLVRALDRYGHHDHDCDRANYTADRPCRCGFNQALQAAIEGRQVKTKPIIHRQRR